MNFLTQYLQLYLLQPIEFTINDKVVRRGKLKLFNFKQYFIKFTLQTDSGDIKTYDVLYPFKIYTENGNCVFNYHLSCFTQNDVETYYRIKTLNKDKCLPTYDGIMILKPLSSIL
jgi:hypothetical protein